MRALSIVWWSCGLALPLLACDGPDDTFRGTTDPCQQGGQCDYFDLVGGEFWMCDLPPASTGEVDMISYEGTTSLVNGAAATFSLTWEGPSLDGRTLVVGVEGDGYYRVPMTSSPQPLVLDLQVLQEVSGDFEVTVGVADDFDDDGLPVTGEWLVIPIQITRVLTGDVQVNVHWDTDNDVDLHVVDPSGEEIYWGSPLGSTGGELDLDSNAGCSIDGINNENIYWPTDDAPTGEYQVAVDLWASCDGEPVEYRVTVILGGTYVTTFDGDFEPEEADQGGAGAGEFVTSFVWNG